jgi:hypothetical protein
LILDATALEPQWFKSVDGVFTKGEFIDTDSKTHERLWIRYGPISDSGVELELTVGDSLRWRAHVQPLGVEHSKYNHQVWLRIIDGQIFVTSRGARTIRETRDLKTGNLISRDVTDNDPK